MRKPTLALDPTDSWLLRWGWIVAVIPSAVVLDESVTFGPESARVAYPEIVDRERRQR
jgi:hypothetical protein